MSCTDDIPPNPQDGRTPLMLAAGAGHLPVARLLVETYHCDVNEEDGKVSGWEVMGGISGYLTCVITLDPLHIYGPFHSGQDMVFASLEWTYEQVLLQPASKVYVKVGFCSHKCPSETYKHKMHTDDP